MYISKFINNFCLELKSAERSCPRHIKTLLLLIAYMWKKSFFCKLANFLPKTIIMIIKKLD